MAKESTLTIEESFQTSWSIMLTAYKKRQHIIGKSQDSRLKTISEIYNTSKHIMARCVRSQKTNQE